MTIIDLSLQFPIVEYYLSQIRDSKSQLNRQRFKKNIYTLGQILALNVSCYLSYEVTDIITPFNIAKCRLLVSRPILVPILRAGLALQEGASSILENCSVIYCACPKEADGRRVAKLNITKPISSNEFIICDPIIAAGKSIISTANALQEIQQIKNLFILSVVASDYSISQMQQILPSSTILLTCAVDHFTPGVKGMYPGLGDAGDLLYGNIK